MVFVNIGYFFVTDRVGQKEVSLEWSPTEDMIGDYATKPTQGALFCKFRDQIMGVVATQNSGPGKNKEKTTTTPSSGKRNRTKTKKSGLV